MRKDGSHSSFGLNQRAKTSGEPGKPIYIACIAGIVLLVLGYRHGWRAGRRKTTNWRVTSDDVPTGRERPIRFRYIA